MSHQASLLQQQGAPLYGATKSEGLAGAALDSGTQHDSSAGALVQLQYCTSRLASAKWAYNNILFSCGFQSPAPVLPRSVATVQIPNEMLQGYISQMSAMWLAASEGREPVSPPLPSLPRATHVTDDSQVGDDF